VAKKSKAKIKIFESDSEENPETAALEAVVKGAGMWDQYLNFIAIIGETAKIKYAHVSEEQQEAFIKTCRYSYCAGVNDTVAKVQGAN